ncbi:hypothetical protein Tco_0839691 [Tanacetum coccineum]|uniref:Uncharacterized protein n=1 Tax=Tanacetum coccineum TaxID=301880 RepID=A0ABQ5AWC5_9ASTR
MAGQRSSTVVNHHWTTSQQWSTSAINGGQQRSTVADHRQPPPDHHQTTAGIVVWSGQRQGQVGSWFGSSCHVAPPAWATWRARNITQHRQSGTRTQDLEVEFLSQLPEPSALEQRLSVLLSRIIGGRRGLVDT